MTLRPLYATAVCCFLAPIALPTITAAEPNWSGLYAGISLSATDSEGGVAGSSVHQHENDDLSLGGYVGYTYANPTTGFVWGPELALSGLGGDDKKVTSAALGTSTLEEGVQLSARVRGGYTFDNLYLYGLAGLTGTNGGIRETSDNDTQVIFVGTLGLGAEWQMDNGWATRIDATQTDYGSDTYDFGGTSHDVDFKVRQISLGLTKRF